MSINETSLPAEPTRSEIEASRGPVLIEFGASWCGYCRGAQALIAKALADYPCVRHIKIEDGKGRRLGRSYRVTLWPTLVLLNDGKEFDRLIRPDNENTLRTALSRIDPAD
jgi:thioredoxin 1